MFIHGRKSKPRDGVITPEGFRRPGPPPSPHLGVVMGPDFVQLSANLGRNLMEGRLGILTAVFEAASTKT
jgi:sarcosine/dimethylglycine N-methyltransferase